MGELRTTFEFELFGTGVDEGQTTFRLRHAYGELGKFGAGQYWSPFMDIDVFPNSLEYWGPAGMVFFRNVQVRYMPIQGDTRLTLAVERPGASGDAGVLADRIELQNVKGRSPIPDFTGEYRFGGSRGYFEVAGILGRMSWDDVLADQFELSGDATRWGINLSSNVKLGSTHDPSVAVCVRRGHPELHERCPRRCRHRPQSRKCRHADRWARPFPLPEPCSSSTTTGAPTGRRQWAIRARTSTTSKGRPPTRIRQGTTRWGISSTRPVPGVMMGGELQWGKREMFKDPYVGEGLKIQFSFKYNFSVKAGG